LLLEDKLGRAYLINASTEIRLQLARYGPWPRQLREAPIWGVFLTDAELDHTLGLLELRQGTPWALWAPVPILKALETCGLLRMLLAYIEVQIYSVTPADEVQLGLLRVRWLPLGSHPPAYSREGERFALLLEEEGRRALVAPAVADLSPLASVLEVADLTLLDGTFFREEEPLEAGLPQDAWSMGHVPVQVSAAWLSGFPGRKIYLHLNNTNPLVDPSSQERAWVASLGLEVAEDGMELEV
jgi:pyrroloquinoline quinone biosynthesis protein B